MFKWDHDPAEGKPVCEIKGERSGLCSDPFKPFPAVQKKEIFQDHLPGTVTLDKRKLLIINPGKDSVYLEKDRAEILDFFLCFRHKRSSVGFSEILIDFQKRVYHIQGKNNRKKIKMIAGWRRILVKYKRDCK